MGLYDERMARMAAEYAASQEPSPPPPQSPEELQQRMAEAMYRMRGTPLPAKPGMPGMIIPSGQEGRGALLQMMAEEQAVAKPQDAAAAAAEEEVPAAILPVLKESTQTGTGEPPAVAPAQGRTLQELMAGTGIPIMQGSGSTSVTSAPLSAADAKRMSERYDAQDEVRRRAEAIKAYTSQSLDRELASQSKASADYQGARRAELAQSTKDVEASVAKQMTANAAALQEIKDARVDPDRRYKGEFGGVQKFTDVIGIALGSFASAWRGGRNYALEIVNAQVDRDIKAQMADLSKKEYVYQAGRNQLTDLYQKTNNLQQAFLLDKAAYLDIAAEKVKEAKAQASSEMAYANMSTAETELVKEKIRTEVQLKQLAHRQVTTRGGPAQMSEPAQLAAKALIMERMGLSPSGKPLGGAGKPGEPGDGKRPTAMVSKDIGGAIGGYKAAEKELTEIALQGSGWGKYLLGKAQKHIKGTEADRYSAWRGAKSVELARIANGGRPSVEDQKIIETILPEYGQPNFGKAAQQVLRYVKSRLDGEIKGLTGAGYSKGMTTGQGYEVGQ